MKNKSLQQRSGFSRSSSFLLKGLILLAIGCAIWLGFTSKNDSSMQLKVSVYDTYVPKKQGGLMHFDILVDANERDLDKIYGFGKEFLATKGQDGQPLTAKQCRFCHVENAKGPIEDAILQRGYYIIEMEGCD